MGQWSLDIAEGHAQGVIHDAIGFVLQEFIGVLDGCDAYRRIADDFTSFLACVFIAVDPEAHQLEIRPVE